MIITVGRPGEQPCLSEPWTRFSARTGPRISASLLPLPEERRILTQGLPVLGVQPRERAERQISDRPLVGSHLLFGHTVARMLEQHPVGDPVDLGELVEDARRRPVNRTVLDLAEVAVLDHPAGLLLDVAQGQPRNITKILQVGAELGRAHLFPQRRAPSAGDRAYRSLLSRPGTAVST